MDQPVPHSLTFNGKPLDDSEIHRQDGRGLRTYCYGLANESEFNTSFAGPYVIDIATRENEIVVTFASQNDPSRQTSLSMPIRQWGPTIRMRHHRVSEYERLWEDFRKNRCSRDDFEAQDIARREHHNASASELMEDAKRAGIRMDHESARDLFAVVAGLTWQLMPERTRGMAGRGSA